MSQMSTPANVRNVVLVHGGFVDGSGDVAARKYGGPSWTRTTDLTLIRGAL
jgi:hypothetical protein